MWQHYLMSSHEKVCVHIDIDFLTIYLSLGQNALPPPKRVSLSLLSSYSILADLGFLLPSLGDIPEGLFQQMITCQTAANEFLRQFWSAIYPSPVDSQSISSIATPAQRALKAAKMVGYLSRTPEKVEALVRMAQQHGVNGSKVETVKTSLYIWIFFLVPFTS